MILPTRNETKRRVSKKTKASWRKHVNVQDVDDFLEDQRLEERLGEPLSTLKDEQLFTISTNSVEQRQLTAKEKKRLRLTAPPKCFSMLQPHTKVPDPIRKRNRVRTREERMCPILKKKEQERKLKGILTPRELQSMNDRKNHEDLKLEKKDKDGFCIDIWNSRDKLNDDEWMDKNTKRHTLRGLGRLNKIAPRVKSDKNMAIANIEIPHPGASYNPSFKDHNDLLTEIAQKEFKIIKQEEHLRRVTKDMFRKVTPDKNHTAWMTEMSQGLPKDEDDGSEDENRVGDDKPYKSVNPPVENKKKTRKQRRKQKEQLLLKEQLLQKKLEKKRRVELHKLKTIKQQIDSHEKKLEKQKQRREKLKAFKKNEPKQIGRLKFVEPDMDFNMREDLTGNLRNVKIEGNLLRDRFNSMQKRNILPVTAKQIRKKAKVKKFVKRGFTSDWKTTVANSNLFPSK